VDAAPQVSLTLVLSVAASALTVVLAVVQWLAKIAWTSREKVMQQSNESAKSMADESLKRVLTLTEAQGKQKDEISDLRADLALVKQAATRTGVDVADIQAKMVSREVFEAEMRAQTASIKQTIESAVRGGDRRYPSSEHGQTPMPPRRGPGE
jgi:hypothetical protein